VDGDADAALRQLAPIVAMQVDGLEQSEIVARALVVAARITGQQGRVNEAVGWLDRALLIAEAEDLQLLAGAIRWQREEFKPILPRSLRVALEAEPVRVRAVGLVVYADDQLHRRDRVAARSHGSVERAYRDRILRLAREGAAVENQRW